MNAKRIIPTLFLLTATVVAQSATPEAPKKARSKKASAPSATEQLASQVQQLRQMMETQQQQIQQLQQQVQSRDQQITALQNAANEARSHAETAAATSSQNAQTVSSLQSTVSDLKANTTNMAATMQEEQKRATEMVESPLAIHFKGVTLTPGGFLAAESVYRQHGTASDVNTPFNSIPFPGADVAHLSEWFGSGRQSRITLLGEGKLKNMKLTGYFETDWLSAGVTSNNNQSNSYTNRQRQIWGQAALNSGWSFTGGQMWSLVTETKKGLDNRTEATPLSIDAQYVVGFSWARQFGFRVVKNFNNKAWLGFSVENPQTTFSARNAPTNFVIGAAGTGGGLYNPTANYSLNYTPDFIVKAAFEPGFGHYEVFGIISNFRDRVYPTGGTPFNDKRTGGGGGANARWSVANKHLDIGIHGLIGDGVGRYGTSSLPDATIRPDGTLSLIHSYQALGTLEWHSTHWDIYANAGGEYAARTMYVNSAGTLVGYGVPTTNSSACRVEAAPSGNSGFAPSTGGCPDTRNLIEGTLGFWYKIYNGPKGRLQLGPQYEYVVRNTWRATTGAPSTNENIVLTSFRYYLP